MRFPALSTATLILASLLPAAYGQDNAVICLDAAHRNWSCAITDVTGHERPDLPFVVAGGLTPPQHAVMQIVIRQHGISLLEVATQAALPLPGAAAIADTLVQLGMVVEQPDPFDPTDAGATRLYPKPAVRPFLVQGQRNELRVFNRKFLTQYAYWITGVTAIQNFAIQDLDEAANLQLAPPSLATPVSKGAAPKGLSATGNLTLRTANDIIGELLNPSTASNPVNEIASDWVTVKREQERLQADQVLFDSTWSALYGSTPLQDPCLPAYGAPTITSITACLTDLNQAEVTNPWPLQPPGGAYTNEDAFRELIISNNKAISMVNAFSGVLTQKSPVLTTQLSAVEGDLATFRADLNTLVGNVHSVEDAFTVSIAMTQEMKIDQIKARLAQTFNAGTKPILDDAELNTRAEEYSRLLGHEPWRSVVTSAQNALREVSHQGTDEAEQLCDSLRCAAPLGQTAVQTCPPPNPGGSTTQSGRLACLVRLIDRHYTQAHATDNENLYEVLPPELATINAEQSQLLARTNQIYDQSRVPQPLQIAIPLGSNHGNLHVYSTVYETETFPRFTVPPPAAGTAIAAGTPVVVAPPQVPAAVAGGTAPTAPSGYPIPLPMFEVHDRYRATVVALFAFSSAKETSIQTQSVTTGTATGSTTDNPLPCTSDAPCTQVKVASGPVHSSAVVGLSYHFHPYDTFPNAISWTHNPKEAFKEGIAIFGGSSVQNFNDYYAGGDLQINHGIQVSLGVNFYRQNVLSPLYVNGGIYQGTPNFTPTQQWSSGLFGGIGLNLSIFRKIFGPVTGIGTKATTSGT